MNLVLLVVLTGLMHATMRFAPETMSEASAIALASGFLLLAGFLAGKLAQSLKMPRLTGYLCIGILTGPGFLGLVPTTIVNQLEIFNGVAIALIALTAGSEMHLSSLRPLWRSLRWITFIAIFGTTLLLTGAVFALSEWIELFPNLADWQRLILSSLVAVVLVSQSPAMVVALRDETQAQGVMTQTVLALVVLADLVVILCFALGSMGAQYALGNEANVIATAAALAWEFLGSALFGVMFGAILAFFMRKVPGGGPLFLIALAVVMAEVGRRLHFDPLLVALSAGIFVANFTPKLTERLRNDLSQASFPVYIAFFAVSGAHITLASLQALALPALGLVLIRGLGLWCGTRLAAHLTQAPSPVGPYAGFGLMPQAGLAFALALIFERNFSDIGPSAATLIVTTIIYNELLTPPLFKWAIKRSGEMNQRAAQSSFPPSQATSSSTDSLT